MTQIIPPVQTWQQKFAHQLEVTFRSGSTYVVLIIGTLATIYTTLTDAQQTALLNTLPFLKGYTPIVGAIAAFLVTKLKPSSAISTQTQDFINEVARLRMNALLKAAGQAEIPAPAAAMTLPIPVPVIAAAPTAVAVDVRPQNTVK